MRNNDDRSALMTAAAMSINWKDMKSIFNSNKVAIYDVDHPTGLPVSLLAAVGPKSDLESVFCLIQELPQALPSFNLE